MSDINERIERLRRLHAAATPGEWEATEVEALSARVKAGITTVVYLEWYITPTESDRQEVQNNHAFIAAAHNDLPAVLDALEEAERWADELHFELTNIEGKLVELDAALRERDEARAVLIQLSGGLHATHVGLWERCDIYPCPDIRGALNEHLVVPR